MIVNRISTRLCACSAAALLAGATLLAQAPGGGGAPGMPQQQAPPTAGQTTTAAPTEAGPAGSAQSMADQSFVSEAMQGNMAEVQLAQLAEQKSQSNDVKQYAQKMAADHSQMNQKWFEPEAKNLGVPEPKGPNKKDKKLVEKLQGLSGDQFDKEYITAMLKDHQDDLKKFKEEADSAQDPTLKQVATQGATIITQHLQLTEQIAKTHNVPVNEKEVSEK